MRTNMGGKRDRLFNVTIYTVLAIFTAIIIYPLYFIMIASISDPNAVASGKVWVFPVGFTLDGFKELGKHQQIWMGYRNTIIYTVAGTLFAVFVNVSAGFALANRNLVGNRFFMVYFTITMFFNGGLIPTFLVVKDFGLYNNPLVMIVPFAVSVYNIIVVRTFFRSSLPEELWDAAQISGCGHLRYYFQIALPLSKAVIAVIALWTAVGHWNAYFNALIYLRDTTYYPLQIFLRDILIVNTMQSAMGTGEAARIALRQAALLRYSVIIISTAPIMVLYPFFQKYFTQGVMIGSVKG